MVGKDVTKAVQSLFISGFLLRELNSMHLILLPKSGHPQTVADYRPITCCGAIYKIITKIQSDKLHLVLPHLVRQNQTAFITDRCIFHNVMIGAELLRLYNRQNSSPRAFFKVDFCKAYDTAQLQFLLDLLEALKFPPSFIQWIKSAVQTVSYSLVLNGEPTPFFLGQQGL